MLYSVVLLLHTLFSSQISAFMEDVLSGRSRKYGVVGEIRQFNLEVYDVYQLCTSFYKKLALIFVSGSLFVRKRRFFDLVKSLWYKSGHRSPR